MRITYRPDGGTEQVWPFKADELPYAEAELVEDALDCTFDEFRGRIVNGHAKSRRALLWVLLRRDAPKLRFSDVQLRRTGELLVEWDSAEIAKMRDLAETDEDLDPEARTSLMGIYDAMEASAREAGEAAPKPEPGPEVTPAPSAEPA